jgi:phage/plasmid-like protein (TIGR03299 family)
MAHNLMEDRRMMYVGETPWHGLGKKLDKPATASEAIEAAELDYEVEKRKIRVDGDGIIPGHYATVNKANNKPLGIVGEKYTVVQNKDAFGFFDKLVGEGQAIYHTAGALGDGERIWLLAKLPKDLLIFKEDVVEKYLCLTNSHNGWSSLRVYFTPIRVVCQNTLNASLGAVKDGVTIRHSGNILSKVDEARRILGLALDFYGKFDEQAVAMSSYKLTQSGVGGYFDTVLGVEDKESTAAINRAQVTKNRLLELFEKGKGNDQKSIRHSVWAAYNAVTEYVDHEKTVKNEDEKAGGRLNSIWFGAGARLKERAFEEALVLVRQKA